MWPIGGGLRRGWCRFSVLNRKVASLYTIISGRIADAEALGATKDIRGRFGSSKRLGGGDALMNAAPDLSSGDRREEALDLAQPREAGRSQLGLSTWVPDQPVADQAGLVCRVVVHRQMEGWNTLSRCSRGSGETRWRGRS